MPNDLKKVWVTDTRNPNSDPFLHPEHLLKLSKHLKKASRPKPRAQRQVTEPARTATTTSKNKEKKD